MPAGTWAGILLSVVAAEVAPPSATSSAPTSAPAAGDFPCWVRVTAEGVYLRSRADRNSAPVARLERHTVLRATGTEYAWHRVTAPPDVFSYVATRYVTRMSPTEGIVSLSEGQLRVRVGSLLTELDPLQSEVQTLVPQGTPVQIRERRGDWYLITPPAGVDFYVASEYVEPITDEQARVLLAGGAAPPEAPGAAPTTRPVEPAELNGPWGQRLLLVETQIAAEAQQDALAQSWTACLAQLRPIAAQPEEPVVAQLAQRWIQQLEQRIADQAALRTARELSGSAARQREQFERELEQVRRTRAPAATQPVATQPTRGKP